LRVGFGESFTHELFALSGMSFMHRIRAVKTGTVKQLTIMPKYTPGCKWYCYVEED
jgi:hypothetical protein